MMSKIQTIDFSLFLHGNDTQRHQTAAQIVDGFKSMGLVKLVKHGVSDETINTLLDQVSAISIMISHVATNCNL